MTAIELAQKILKIQELVEGIEVKGYENEIKAVTCYELCTEILVELKQVIEENQNGSKEEGEIVG